MPPIKKAKLHFIATLDVCVRTKNINIYTCRHMYNKMTLLCMWCLCVRRLGGNVQYKVYCLATSILTVFLAYIYGMYFGLCSLCADAIYGSKVMAHIDIKGAFIYFRFINSFDNDIAPARVISEFFSSNHLTKRERLIPFFMAWKFETLFYDTKFKIYHRYSKLSE